LASATASSCAMSGSAESFAMAALGLRADCDDKKPGAPKGSRALSDDRPDIRDRIAGQSIQLDGKLA
jgi:hypothetical protein